MPRARKVKVGVIGLGVGRHHLEAYANNNKATVTAISDADPRRLDEFSAKYHVGTALASWEDMIKLDNVDAVSIALPNYLHAPVSVAALEAGKHVVCEKPMALNAAQAGEMVRAAHAAGRKLMIAYNNRFRTESQLLKRLIEAGDLGDIYYAKTGWLRRRGIPGAGTWFTDKARSGGGPLIDLGVHMIDLTLWLMGGPEPLSVTGATYAKFQRMVRRKGKYDVEDLATALIRVEGGATLIAEASWASNVAAEGTYVTLFGTKGGAELRGDTVKVYGELHGTLADITPLYSPRTWRDCIAAEIDHFLDCIRRGKEPMASGEQGLNLMRILDAVYESARTGTEVALRPTPRECSPTERTRAASQ